MGDDFTVNLNDLKMTGVIKCPYCGKSKAYIYNDASGMFSSECGRCKRLVLWDFDHKAAYKASAKKFAC